ncbi:uncharacterized protein sb:cb1058 [Danio aesculapii]|uniref:uncharacterized protein sb:cb1058 n=1 Tax=Danio aesculapii TaxID=1142201 RepID=UPI0024BF9E8E|nr:uncharacterized protein sb:cb1058 [Danio aesculapii]XP_056317319.1 uncharacterized protein sb:cb1058 [Danio aesculapii]
MTIGRSFKKNQVPRTPAFLDKTNGFYGRLDEMFRDDVQMEGETKEEQPSSQDNGPAPGWIEEDDHVVDFNQGMMDDDDGTTLLKRKPSRLSRRWSRMSSRKAKYGKFSSEKELGNETSTSVDLKPEEALPSQTLENNREPEPTMVHFSAKEHADDQILIKGKKEGEVEDMKIEGKLNGETMEVVKRNTLKNYRKAVDRAFRRGWETFVANLYSVTLTPISSTSSSAPSDKTQLNKNRVLAEFR